MTKAVWEFLKTTLIGGLLIVVPAYVTVLLLAKALKGIAALFDPIEKRGDYYQNDLWDNAKVNVRLKVQGGIGEIKIIG